MQLVWLGAPGCPPGTILVDTTGSGPGEGRFCRRKLTSRDSADGTLGLLEDNSVGTIYSAAGLATSIAGAYHGYKRNHGSVGWSIGWFIFGGLIWPLALPIMLAEGFGEPK
jgi:hypothetical protein